MKKFYLTFGNNHMPSGNMFYVVVNAESEKAARAAAVKEYGERWAFIYPEERYQEAIGRFNMIKLTEI
jgi:hypothetical protein